MTFEVKRQLR